MQNGGTADGTLRNAYRFDAYTLRVNGQSPSGNKPAQFEMAGRQIVYGPYALGGVEATRRLFVPSTGGFARYLDTVTNTSALPVTVDVQVEGALGGVVHVVVDPSTTSNSYAVTLADPTTVSVSEERPGDTSRTRARVRRPERAGSGVGDPYPAAALRRPTTDGRSPFRPGPP